MTTVADPTLDHQVVLIQNGQRHETRLDELHDSEIAMSCNCWSFRDVSGNTSHTRIAPAPNMEALERAHNNPANHNPRVRPLRDDEKLGRWRDS